MRLHLGSKKNKQKIAALKGIRPQKKFCWLPEKTQDGDLIWLEWAWFASDVRIGCSLVDDTSVLVVQTKVYPIEDKPQPGRIVKTELFPLNTESLFDRLYKYGQIYPFEFNSTELCIIENLLGNAIPSWYKGDTNEFWEALHYRKDALLSIGTKGSKGCL